MSKAKSQIKHAQMRARQRYGLHLTRNDIVDVAQACRARRGTISATKQTNTRTIIHLIWNDHEIKVAYDKSRGTIATFLPLESEVGAYDD